VSRRVVIADDHVPTRAGIRAALEDHGFEVVAETGTASAAVEAALRERPDICLLDIHMPGNGIAAAAQIGAALPGTAIVMLTVSTTDEDLFDALKAGASGYLLKDIDPARLPKALEGVLDGEAALPRKLAARLIDEFRRREHHRSPLRERGAELTAREWEVLELLQQGLKTGEIASRLFISRGTVRTHIAATVKKLRVPDRDGAIRLLAEAENSQGVSGGEERPAAS
jgi:DNA-binding NarL/FixJ family response regulator